MNNRRTGYYPWLYVGQLQVYNNNYLALTCLKYIVLFICDKCPQLRI